MDVKEKKVRKYCPHYISLGENENEKLVKLTEGPKKWKIIDIFRLGLENALAQRRGSNA